MNIYIAGIYSAGKTAAAQELSKLLGMPVVDPDDLFVEKYGPHAEFSKRHGWGRIVEIWPELLAQVPDGSIVPNSFFGNPAYDAHGIRDIESCKLRGVIILIVPDPDLERSAAICHERCKRRGYDITPDDVRRNLLHSMTLYARYVDAIVYDSSSPASAAKRIKEVLEEKDLL